MKSLNPLMTCGCCVNPGSALIMPDVDRALPGLREFAVLPVDDRNARRPLYPASLAVTILVAQ